MIDVLDEQDADEEALERAQKQAEMDRNNDADANDTKLDQPQQVHSFEIKREELNVVRLRCSELDW